MRDDKSAMDACLAAVVEFMEAGDVELHTLNVDPSKDEVDLCISLIREEVVNETIPILEKAIHTDLARHEQAELADGIADSIYVLLYTAAKFGLPMGRVWAAVVAANLAKIDPETGKVRKREDGKILKPEGWQEPDILSIIQEAKK